MVACLATGTLGTFSAVLCARDTVFLKIHIAGPVSTRNFTDSPITNFFVDARSAEITAAIISAYFIFAIRLTEIAVALVEIISLAIEHFIAEPISQPFRENAFVRVITGWELSFCTADRLNHRITFLTAVFGAELYAGSIPIDFTAERFLCTDAILTFAVFTSRCV